MPTEEMKFEELLKEYIEVIESTDVKKLKEDNRIMEIDIERKGKEEKDIDARIEQIQAELDSLNENPTVRLEYPEAIKDKEDKLHEAKNFKEKKQEEIKKLKDATKENNKKIRKVNNIAKNVIKKAEEKTAKENEELDKKIVELEERKANYGLKRIDKDGKESIQFTKEEKVVVAGINEEIRELKNKKAQNLIALKKFKDIIAEAKKDKAAFLALKDKVKGKEKPEQDLKKEEPKQQANQEKVEEEPKPEQPKENTEIGSGKKGRAESVPAKEEPKQQENETKVKEEPKPEQPRENTGKSSKGKPEPKPTGKTEEKGDNGEPNKSNIAKGEIKGKVIPGVAKPEEEIHEVKAEEEEENNYSDSYNKNLQAYKDMLSMYKDAVLVLGDLQQQYENGEIDYSEYEKQALYVADRYKFMMNEYAKIKDLYDKEKVPQDKFAGLSNEDLENKLKELDEETTELWQQGVHENTPDAKRYHELLEEIKRIKEELQQRKENPLRGMSLEELEAKRHELYGRIGEQQEPDEYHFRTHKENGLEGYEEDDIDRGLREIREEIERRKPKNIEAPEEPVKAGMILENDRGEETPPEEVKIEKTGLQIFREQLHKMPEIKDRHTASERVKIAAPIGVTAGALTLGIPVVGIPLMVGSMAAAPIVARLTGQRKLEKQIEAQFHDMSEEDFNKMMDFLTEEKISELKPNAVILRALHRESLTRTKQKSQELTERFQEIEATKEEILQRLEKGTISREEADILLGSLNAESREVESQAAATEKRLKDIQRGKDRVSAAYKGNLKTRFNIFARRNTSTEMYLPVIDELADAELERDEAAAKGDGTGATIADRKMQQVMQENTYTNRLGIQRSIFNARQKPVKIMSDRRDETIRGTCTAVVITTGLAMSAAKMAEYEQAQRINQAEWNKAQQSINGMQQGVNGITKGDVQLTADGQVTDAYAQAEHAIINENGVTTSQAYRQGDIWVQQEGGKVANGSQVQGNDQVSWLDSLIGTMKSRAGIAQRYGNSAQNLTLSSNAADHTVQTSFTGNAQQQLNGEISLMEKLRDIVAGASKLGPLPAFKTVKFSLLGPITTAIGSIMQGTRGRQENKEAKDNLRAVETKEESR